MTTQAISNCSNVNGVRHVQPASPATSSQATPASPADTLHTSAPEHDGRGMSNQHMSNLFDSLGLNPAVPSSIGRGANSVRNLVKGSGNDDLYGTFNSSLARGGIGALAGVGGALQADKGISELEHGKALDGGADVGSGVSNLAGAGLVLADSPAAPIAFGAASLVDGTRNLIHGIQAGNAEQIGVGAGKDLGGGLLVAGGAIALANPPLGAVVAGVGGLISLGSTIYQNRQAIGHFIGHTASTVGHALGSAAHSVGHFFSSLF